MLCLFQPILPTTYIVVLSVLNSLRREVVVRFLGGLFFVEISEIVDHQCLKFIF
jgi:hypothetical protein